MEREAPTIPRACLERLAITPQRYLGGRARQHWLVEAAAGPLVLRGYPAEPFADVAYEHEVLRRLRELGWPAASLIEDPISVSGRIWCLFPVLPGTPREQNGSVERKERGRLLAEFHESTAGLADMGQRTGFETADEVARRPNLPDAIRTYEQLRPATGHILRWHLDVLLSDLEQIVLQDAETIVIHSDFALWNLLFDGDELSGLLDLESTHLNYRVSDFALSWRGYQDEVIEGYEEVRVLNEFDTAMLIPAYWSWLFIGMERWIDDIVSGRSPIHDFDWPVKKLLTRSKVYGRDRPMYPGSKA